ncbi:MAG: sugar transferase, partial [Gemmatimonadota bacterium]|nr:sugar transferase [Gemmatimonadota bacterium]
MQRCRRRSRSSRRERVRGHAETAETAETAERREPPRLARDVDDARDPQGAVTAASPPGLLSNAYSERANRALNVLLAAVALVLLSPFLILIAFAVKLTSRGPILYAQVRVGVDRRARTERRAAADRRNGGERRLGLDRR